MNGLPFSILLVDDDEDDRVIMDDAFIEIGYEAEIKKFITGADLFHYLEQIDSSLYPSLIVLDNNLYGLSATDILLRLKESSSYSSIPVVIYSTVLTPSKKAQLLSMGAYRCIEKGAVFSDLVAIAKSLRDLAEKKISDSER